jgi:hypothetical protein
MPTRFPAGISTEKKGKPLSEFGLPDPVGFWHQWYDDFNKYTVGDWIVTTTEAGTGSATEAINDEKNGCLKLTNAAGDDDLDFIQTASEIIKIDSTKLFVFKSKFKLSDVTQTEFVMGVQIKDTTPLSASDGIFFQKDDGDAYLDVYCQKDTSESKAAHAIATMSDDTYLEAAFAYDANQYITAYVDGAQVGQLDLKSGSNAAVTDFLPDTELCVSFGIQNGEAVAKVMTIDYILAANER